MTISFNEEKQDKKVLELHLKEAEDLAQVLAGHHNLPYADLSTVSINTDALRLIPEPEARLAKVATFRMIGKKIFLGILSPANDHLVGVIKDLENKNFLVEKYLVSETSLARAWERYAEIHLGEKTEAGLIEISSERVGSFLETLKNLTDVQTKINAEVITLLKEGGVSILVEVILAGALATEASDIHFEPEAESVRLRYRLDGVLLNVAQLPEKTYNQILSRIKLVSGLKLNIKKSAQDGRFSIKATDLEIEIRTSVIPGAYGESVVLRVLNPKNIAVEFESLGIEPDLFKIFDREIKKPNGLILLTGPTGSGKTTTLYAFLRRVNSPENKTITIEDPIEYHLKGISQTQVNTKQGYTFLSGLRSALRQDPDIIMVGEIRDSETAKIAVNAALTGHLVFSTLHTNNAAGAIPRLIDLDVNPKIISSALTLSIAQRLVRKLCLNCKITDTPTTEEKDLIEKIKTSIKKKRPEFIFPAGEQIWRAGHCDKCHQTGFKGRIGIFEAIQMTESIAKVTIENPSEREIITISISQGILDMRQDGIIKVLTGLTAIEEVGRVVDLYGEII